MLAGICRAFKLDHLEGAYDATRVVRMDKIGTLGIDPGKLFPESLRSVLFEKTLIRHSNRVLDLLAMGEGVIVNRGSDIQPRTTRKNARLPCTIGPLEQIARISLKQGGGIRLARVADINAVMHDLAVGGKNLSRSYVHTAIDLHGVGRDDRGAEA